MMYQGKEVELLSEKTIFWEKLPGLKFRKKVNFYRFRYMI